MSHCFPPKRPLSYATVLSSTIKLEPEFCNTSHKISPILSLSTRVSVILTRQNTSKRWHQNTNAQGPALFEIRGEDNNTEQQQKLEEDQGFKRLAARQFIEQFNPATMACETSLLNKVDLESLHIGEFKTILDTTNSSEDVSVFRAAISSEDEDDVKVWLPEFSTTTHTEWIVNQTYPKHQRQGPQFFEAAVPFLTLVEFVLTV